MALVLSRPPSIEQKTEVIEDIIDSVYTTLAQSVVQRIENSFVHHPSSFLGHSRLVGYGNIRVENFLRIGDVSLSGAFFHGLEEGVVPNILQALGPSISCTCHLVCKPAV